MHYLDAKEGFAPPNARARSAVSGRQFSKKNALKAP